MKSDLRQKRTCIELLRTQGLTPVTPEQGDTVAKRMGASYVECSSKEMRGVDEVFGLAVNTAVAAEEEQWADNINNNNNTMHSSKRLTTGGGGVSSTNKSTSSFTSSTPSGAGGQGRSAGGKKVKKRSCRIL